VLYVWPAPNADAADEYSLITTYLRRIDDMLASNDDLDMPQEWLDPVIWLLADDLETEYPVNDPRLALKIERKAAESQANPRLLGYRGHLDLHAAGQCLGS
jgi:hypothetical protein